MLGIHKNVESRSGYSVERYHVSTFGHVNCLHEQMDVISHYDFMKISSYIYEILLCFHITYTNAVRQTVLLNHFIEDLMKKADC